MVCGAPQGPCSQAPCCCCLRSKGQNCVPRWLCRTRTWIAAKRNCEWEPDVSRSALREQSAGESETHILPQLPAATSLQTCAQLWGVGCGNLYVHD
jgi:hypothetical protein